MKSPKLLEGAIARTSALLTETGRDVEAAIAARQANALQVGRQIGARVGRAALHLARSQVAAPGLERQLMRVVAATAPKLAAPQSKTSTKPRAPQLSAPPAAIRRGGRRAPEPLMGALGKYGSSALPSKVKGDLGGALSYAKSVARDGRLPKTQIGVDVGGRRTIADQLLDDGSLLEAKFGRWAKLSPAQRAALRKLRDKYLIDHYQPRDVGRILGFGPAISTGQMAGDDHSYGAP